MPWGSLVRSGPRRTFKMRAKPVREALLGRRNYRTSAVSAPGPVLIGSYRSFPCVAPIPHVGYEQTRQTAEALSRVLE